MIRTINFKRALLAGVLGTVLFDVVGLLFTGQWWDIPQLLGARTELGTAYGVIGHYSNGALLAVLYTGIRSSLWGPDWLRAITFTTAETVALVWFFMLPLLGAGVAGMATDPLTPLISILRHWAYAIPLMLFITDQSGYSFRKSH